MSEVQRIAACAHDVRTCLSLIDEPMAAAILTAVAEDLERLIKG